MCNQQMKKLILGIIILCAIAVAGSWYVVSIRAKAKYDQVSMELSVFKYTVKPIDEGFTAFLADVEKTWSVRYSETGGPHSDGLKLAGLSPSAANLTHVFTCPMPNWSWVSPQRNRDSAALGAAKALLLPVTVDGAIHVSADKGMAVIRCTTNTIYVFRDDPQGMRETLYVRKEASNQGSDVTSQPAPSADSSAHQD